MKKIFLGLSAGLVTTLSAASIATGCACKSTTEKHIEIYSKTDKIVGNQTSGTLIFNLSSKLKDSQTLSVKETSGKKSFTFSKPTVWNNVVTITYSKTDACPVGKSVNMTLLFTCTEGDQTVWTEEIRDIELCYSNAISLSESCYKEDWTEEGEATKIYEFDLGEALPSDHELKVNLIRSDSSSSNVYGNTALIPQLSEDRTKATITVGITKQVGTVTSTPSYGEHVDFGLKFICNDANGDAQWNQNINGFKLSYFAEEVAIPTAALQVTGSVLTGIDFSQFVSGVEYNVLNIPHYIQDTNGNKITINTVKENFWPEMYANHAEELDKIKVLRLGWESGCCLNYLANSFRNANFKVIDVSEIPNEVRGLKDLLNIAEVDSTADNGAFSGLKNDEGTIKWNSDVTLYKKHIIKSKLWRGGLQSSKWFDIHEVSTREELVEHLDQGGTVKLTDDIDISTGSDTETKGQIDVYVGSVIDLNGHWIKASKPVYNTKSAEYAMITVWNSAELVITDSSVSEEYPDEKGGIAAVDGSDPEIIEKWKEILPNGIITEAIDVRTELPDREQAILEIMSGNFYGNETCIELRQCIAFLEGGTYHVYKPDGKTEQLYYDRILNCVDKEPGVLDPSKKYSNFHIYAGKFYGKYIQGSYANYQKLKGFNYIFYKDNWSKTPGDQKICWPIYDKAYEHDSQMYDEFEDPVAAEELYLDYDECWSNPFITYSEPDRIYKRNDESTWEKPKWTTWKPTDSAADVYNFSIKYHKHDANNDNYVEISSQIKPVTPSI